MMVEDCAGTPSGGSCPAHPLVTFHGRNPPMKLLRPLGAFAALVLLVAPGLTAQAAPARLELLQDRISLKVGESAQIRTRILAHDLTDDEPLPSIRALARDQRVSVITVQRAYEDLEREGLIRSRPGKGFFVMAIPEKRKRAVALERFITAITPIIEESRRAGLGDEQLRILFNRVLRGNEHGGKQ